MIYTKKELDDFIIRVTDAIEGVYPENIELSGPILEPSKMPVKLRDFIKDEEIYGFYGVYTDTDLFWIGLEIPSCKNKVEDVKNILIYIELNKKSNTHILTNHDKRNDFIKFLYHQYESEFKKDESNGIWKYTEYVNPKSSIKIEKRFYVKKTGLPPVDDVVRSFKILANLDIPAALKKWQEQRLDP
ncbi:MAG: hypothetical protein PWQ82_1717 [Thermosediminibacterales bacterium]|nr:hypothetical protein [Thermosediminibacterales bacterium]MDK2836233.1 hypothetical protein [Thermosediminibacterales bacterium]